MILRMDNQSIQSLCRWLKEIQGVTLPLERFAEPQAVVARIALPTRAAAAKLPFDVDPTGFSADLEKLAARYASDE
jgi:hypothetical protein